MVSTLRYITTNSQKSKTKRKILETRGKYRVLYNSCKGIPVKVFSRSLTDQEGMKRQIQSPERNKTENQKTTLRKVVFQK